VASSKIPDGITIHDIIAYTKIDNAMKKLEPRKKLLSEKLKAAFKKKGSFTYELEEPDSQGNIQTVGSAVTIGDRTEFNKDKAAEDFPYEEFPQYYTHVLDKTKLPVDVREEYESKILTLSVKLITDLED